MTLTRTMVASLALVATSALTGCSSAYLDAVTTYATTSADSIKSLAAVPTTAASVCRKRAAANFLTLHLEGPAPSALWEDYYTTPNGVVGMSWKDYCDDIQATTKNYSALLTILSTYAEAMKKLAAEGKWDGTQANTLATNMGTLAGAKTPVGQVLTNLAPSAQALASAIVGVYTGRAAHDFAVKANSATQAILDGLATYLDKIDKDLIEATNKDRVKMLRSLEKNGNVWSAPLDAGRITGFMTYAQSADDDIASLTAAAGGYKDLVDKLKKAHNTLATKPAEEASATDIFNAAVAILNAVNQIQTGLSSTSSSK